MIILRQNGFLRSLPYIYEKINEKRNIANPTQFKVYRFHHKTLKLLLMGRREVQKSP